MKIKKLNVAVSCFMGSIISTLMIMVFNFLVMLFSSGDDGRRTCFFDSIYFNSVTEENGTVTIGFGLTGQVEAIIISILIWFAFYLLVYFIYDWLRAYRENLIEERKGKKDAQ